MPKHKIIWTYKGLMYPWWSWQAAGGLEDTGKEFSLCYSLEYLAATILNSNDITLILVLHTALTYKSVCPPGNLLVDPGNQFGFVHLWQMHISVYRSAQEGG